MQEVETQRPPLVLAPAHHVLLALASLITGYSVGDAGSTSTTDQTADGWMWTPWRETPEIPDSSDFKLHRDTRELDRRPSCRVSESSTEDRQGDGRAPCGTGHETWKVLAVR